MDINIIKTEIIAAADYVRSNKREIAIFCLSTLFLILCRYNRIGPGYVNALIYFLVLPLLTILALRENPLEFGLRPGNWRIGVVHTVAACLIMLPVLYLSSGLSGLRAYYGEVDITPVYFLHRMISIFSWEFFLRGFLLFGLARKFRESSILIQMVPFALLHIGKPEIEAVGCIISGIYFGYVNYRTNALWPSVVIHVYVNFANIIFIDL